VCVAVRVILVVFVVKKFCRFLAKLQTAITFALVIETGQILYQFGVEFNNIILVQHKISIRKFKFYQIK